MESTPFEPPEPISAGDGAFAHVSRPRRWGIGRLLEWFWRGSALAAARAQAASAGARSDERQRRARLAAQVAARALEPRERFTDGDAAFVACELYRQAAYWGLCALRMSGDARAADSRADREALWSSTDPALLQRVARDPAELGKLRSAFVESSFVDFAELPYYEQAREAVRLRTLVSVVLDRLDAPRRTLDQLWLQRLVRCGLVLVIGAIALVVTHRILDERQPDLAKGKAWRASTDYGLGGCKSPAQACIEGNYYFFHTREQQDPWLEIDLGGVRRFSGVRVINREDCCFERAVPLVLETSNDQKQWKKVAQRTEPFSDWTADVAKGTQARWVRLRVKGKGPFHLKQVRVIP